VVAAAVVLDPRRGIPGLADSKTLNTGQRRDLEPRIKDAALAWGLGRAEPAEIDDLNILRASLLAMRRAVMALVVIPDFVVADGLYHPDVPYPCLAVVRGDQMFLPICAASILAKEARDREMVALDHQYPGYGFAQHKGYPTKAHLRALARLGVSCVHRRSFGPVKVYV
jgi:ribonuclease HII